MDIVKLISELRQERERIDLAIQSLERLSSSPRRPGRPPKWMSESRSSADKRAKTTPTTFTAAASSGDGSGNE